MGKGDIVIGGYRPHPGREAELHALVAEHVPILRRLGLATVRPSQAMRAADGTVIERCTAQTESGCGTASPYAGAVRAGGSGGCHRTGCGGRLGRLTPTRKARRGRR